MLEYDAGNEDLRSGNRFPRLILKLTKRAVYFATGDNDFR